MRHLGVSSGSDPCPYPLSRKNHVAALAAPHHKGQCQRDGPSAGSLKWRDVPELALYKKNDKKI